MKKELYPIEFSAVQAARKLGITLDYVYRQLAVGQLKGRKVGKQWRIQAADVEARMKDRASND